MVAVFFTFTLAGELPVKEMGTILGVAVLLDAFIVRLTLLPVLLRLTGRAAWYTPRWLSRILPAITFSHGRPGRDQSVDWSTSWHIFRISEITRALGSENHAPQHCPI